MKQFLKYLRNLTCLLTKEIYNLAQTILLLYDFIDLKKCLFLLLVC